MDTIAETKEFDDDTTQSLADAVDEFKKTFETHEGKLLVNDPAVEALERDEVEQEKITRRVKPKPKQG